MNTNELEMTCDSCGGRIIPIRFIEHERDTYSILTGRVKNAVSHLECNFCMKKIIIDDSFDGDWYYPKQ